MPTKYSASLATSCLLLSSCLTTPPTSSFDGIYSTTTGLLFGPGHGAGSYYGYPDNKVLEFRRPDHNCPEQEKVSPPRLRDNVFKDLPNPPGIVSTLSDSFGIDEAEIPNQEWQLFQLQQENQGVATAALVPRTDALPVPDYYTNPAYHYFPVVGISYEQAQAFCQWRSQVVTNTLNQKLHHPDPGSPEYIRCTYRLPTEAEWELAATAGPPPCPVWQVQINPKAAAYLKTRSGSQRDAATIKTDIEVYNQHNPSHSIINYQQTEPYFLRLQMPVWVYQGPATSGGLFQLLGNVAEMVQEPGLTKGGSYLDPLEACTPKAQGRYAGPAPAVGFRCVCSFSYPNRK